MPVIDPVPVEELEEDKALARMLEQAESLRAPDPLLLRIMAHAPSHAQAVWDAFWVSHAEGNVDHKLKEIIRIRLARFAGDPYFANLRSTMAREAGLTEETIEAGCGDFENDGRFSDAEKWALEYSALMYTDPKAVNAAFYDEGKRHWSEAEIMEIGVLIAYHYGFAVWMKTLKAFPLHDPDGNPVSQEESAKAYGAG